MSNGQVCKICREIEYHSVSVMYYLKFKTCNGKETYIGKTIGDNTKGFKVRINQHIFDRKRGFQHASFHVMFKIVVLRIIA